MPRKRSVLCKPIFAGGSNLQVAGCRLRVAGHCFTNTEITMPCNPRPATCKLDPPDLRTQDSKLEYLENQSRRNNIRVSGIPESHDETWEVAEAKVKQAIQEQLGTDVDIERAHRVERRNRDSSSQDTQQRKPCTIVCKLRCWKQREAVLKKARKSRLSFMQVNTRSLQCNLDGLTNMLLHLDLKFSFIGISET